MDNKHLIGKQIFELALSNRQTAFSLQQQLATDYWSKVAPRLEKLFNKLAGPERIIRIEKLEIDLGRIAETELEENAADRIINLLEKELNKQIALVGEKRLVRLSPRSSSFQIWLFFLEYGFLPWNAAAETDSKTLLKNAIDSIASHVTSFDSLRRLLLRKPLVMDRLVLQFSSKEIAVLMEAVSGQRRQSWEALLEVLLGLSFSFKGKSLLSFYRSSNWQRELKSPLAFSKLRELKVFYWSYLLDLYLIRRERSGWQKTGIKLVQMITGMPERSVLPLLVSVKRECLLSSNTANIVSEWVDGSNKEKGFSAQIGKEKPYKLERQIERSSPRIDGEMKRESDEENKDAFAKGKKESIKRPDQKVKKRADMKFVVSETREDRHKDGTTTFRDEELKPTSSERIKIGSVQKDEEKQTKLSEKEPAQPDQNLEQENEIKTERLYEKAIEHEKPLASAMEPKDVVKNKVSQNSYDSTPQKDREINRARLKNENKRFPELGEPLPGREKGRHKASKEDGRKAILGVSERWQAYIRDYREEKLSTTQSGKTLSYQTMDEMLTDNGLYVKCAGIVLAHPFIPSYFRKIGLVKEEAFVGEEAQIKAIHLIHYLATKDTNLPEYELMLPKFLCGLPLDDPIERAVDVSDSEKEEGEKMLQAAVDHWGALGKVTPDSLRQGFLWRDGKLEHKESGWTLTVEQHTMDILLDRLPFGWGVSMIKFPWMKELLKVDWI